MWEWESIQLRNIKSRSGNILVIAQAADCRSSSLPYNLFSPILRLRYSTMNTNEKFPKICARQRYNRPTRECVGVKCVGVDSVEANQLPKAFLRFLLMCIMEEVTWSNSSGGGKA